MNTITDIMFDGEELTAVIRVAGKPRATMCILGDALDTQSDRNQALIDEASRMGYANATIAQSIWQRGGHARAKNMTPEQRKVSAKKAALARWYKK